MPRKKHANSENPAAQENVEALVKKRFQCKKSFESLAESDAPDLLCDLDVFPLEFIKMPTGNFLLIKLQYL